MAPLPSTFVGSVHHLGEAFHVRFFCKPRGAPRGPSLSMAEVLTAATPTPHTMSPKAGVQATLTRLDARAAAAAAAARVALLTSKTAAAHARHAMSTPSEAFARVERAVESATAVRVEGAHMSYATVILVAVAMVAAVVMLGVCAAMQWLRMPWTNTMKGPKPVDTHKVPAPPATDIASVFLHGVDITVPHTVTQGAGGADALFDVGVHMTWGGSLPPSAPLTLTACPGTPQETSREILMVGDQTSQTVQFNATELPVGTAAWLLRAEWKGETFQNTAVTTVLAAPTTTTSD